MTDRFFISIVLLYDPTHFGFDEDTPLEDLFGGVYTGVQVCVWQENTLVSSMEYGSYYKDKGREKADAFADGFFASVDSLLNISTPRQYFHSKAPIVSRKDLKHCIPQPNNTPPL